MTQQQVDLIKKVREDVSKLTIKLGQLEINKMILEESINNNQTEINTSKVEFKKVRERENTLIKELTLSYGEHSLIDIEKEIIILK